MSGGYTTTKGDIQIFLKELKEILENPKSKLNIIPRQDKAIEFSTDYCLRDLGFTDKDIKEELKKLKISEYVECCRDERNIKSRNYYIFCKEYNKRQVYIKIKIQSYDNKIILCMSFHYAEYKITKFPFRLKEEKYMKELKKVNMFCSICEEIHEVSLIEEEKETIIKGEKIKYKELYYKCNKYTDNNIFMTGELWNINLVNSLDAYRRKKDLLTSKEIKEIREKYGLTQSEMAFLLNLGEITITRYETKQIQDASVDNMIRELNDNPLFALKLLEKNKAKFKRYENIEKNIKDIIDKNVISFLNEQELIAKYAEYNNESIENGNRILDIEKLKNIVRIYY